MVASEGAASSSRARPAGGGTLAGGMRGEGFGTPRTTFYLENRRICGGWRRKSGGQVNPTDPGPSLSLENRCGPNSPPTPRKHDRFLSKATLAGAAEITPRTPPAESFPPANTEVRTPW
jgi:hypothetical protein